MTGTVEAGGIDTARSDTATLSTHVAMVFQDPDAQIVTGTVYDEVAFGPENLLLPLDEVRARAEDALRRVGLWQRRDENPDRLSGGGRQRLAIACALAMGSPLLVLDEPTANLDPQGIEDVYAALADVVAAGDRAILLVEHNLDAAMEFVTRTIVLDQAGTVAFDGPVDEILRGHTEELVSMGVWLPAATLTARMLRERGILSHDAPLPLTPVELAEMLSDRVSDGTLSEPLALNGLIPHALPATMTGTVEAGGIDTARSDTATLSTHVAMVFQDPDAQIVTGTVYDEVAFGPENLLLPLDEVRARAEDALRRVGLWQRRDENPDRLSGGGRQRLVIACALAMGSPLLVLDEPTANLDPQGIEDVYAALADVVAAGDRAILLVEHNLDAAMEFVTRTIVLDQAGTVAFDGPVDEILRGHTEELVSMGVWLPAATLTARMLRERGILSHDAPLPLTPVELAEMLSDRVSDGTLSERDADGTDAARARHPVSRCAAAADAG